MNNRSEDSELSSGGATTTTLGVESMPARKCQSPICERAAVDAYTIHRCPSLGSGSR